jgi:hypothetical protein
MFNIKFTPASVMHSLNLKNIGKWARPNKFGVLAEGIDMFIIIIIIIIIITTTTAADGRKSLLTLNPSEGKLRLAGFLGLEHKVAVVASTRNSYFGSRK